MSPAQNSPESDQYVSDRILYEKIMNYGCASIYGVTTWAVAELMPLEAMSSNEVSVGSGIALGLLALDSLKKQTAEKLK